MNESQELLERRCQLTWNKMCRNWTAVIQRKQRIDALKQQKKAANPKPKSNYMVETDDSSEEDLTESPDIAIGTSEYNGDVEIVSAKLLKHAVEAQDNWELMDTTIYSLLHCSVPSWHKSTGPVHKTISILNRLPKSSLPLSDDLWSALNNSKSDYIGRPRTLPHSTPSPKANASMWEGHRVTTVVDTNSIRLALLTAYLEQTTHRGVADTITAYANILSDILDRITTLENDTPVDINPSIHRHSCHVARAFVWTAWQRWLQVSAYYLFGTRLRRQSNPEDWHPNPPQPYEEIVLGAIGNSLKTVDQTGLACNYMCRHSFDVVKLSMPGSQDLRSVIHQYNDRFGERPARCYQEGSTWVHCKSSASFCIRCIKSAPGDQSAHDQTCSGRCEKIIWDKESYITTQAPRSVELSLRQPKAALQYRQATGQTMAISHVWSHGQGGRPEEGFNQCLHNRYSAIASNLGCDSYWIDTACIPSDDDLRSEAIKTINPTFRDSKVTLISDKDIMSIDAQDMSRQQCESLISSLLLSDWNIRAWTLLEGIRGNRNIYLLCKNNLPVPFHDILSVLYKQGSVDLCGVLIGSPHLLPMGEEISAVELETAGVMLSRRFASRPGDDVIIWDLLCGNDAAQKRPEQFWKSRLRKPIKSGFLMSTCERVKGIRGLSWAPSSPCSNLSVADSSFTDPLQPKSRVFYPYDGASTGGVTFQNTKGRNCNTALHLRGDWFVYVVHASDLEQHPIAPDSCWERAQRLLSSSEYKKVIFLRPIFVRTYLVMPSDTAFTGARHLDEGEEAPVAVCATKDDREKLDPFRLASELTYTNELWGEEWEWKGVYKEAPYGSIDKSKFEVRILRII